MIFVIALPLVLVFDFQNIKTVPRQFSSVYHTDTYSVTRLLSSVITDNYTDIYKA